jgi:ribonuclease R
MEYMKDYILNLMRKSAYRPMSMKDLIRHFNVPKDKRDHFKEIIRQLTETGEVVLIKGRKYGLPKKMNLVVGLLTVHPDGFGFVTPEEGGDDVFIKNRNLNTAMHGDKVVVRLEHFGREEKSEGRVIRILERARSRVVGCYEKFSTYGYVTPYDPRLTTDIYIPIKNSREAQTGQMAVVEIVNYSSRNRTPEGRILEILGQADDPGVDEMVVARHFNLDDRFSRKAAQEARELPREVGEGERRGRKDLRNVITVTIDGETARDFDDAISIDLSDKKTFLLWVHIADVGHYVLPDSCLDRDAREKGTSVYFPGMVLPMLPEELSTGICSLNPGVDRLAFSVFMEIDRLGKPLRYDFLETVIRSDARMTYTQIKDLLEGRGSPPSSLPEGALEKFKTMKELAQKLRAVRLRRGSIDFDLPAPELILDLSGRITDIYRSERNIAHRIIEEFMLAANETVASYMAQQKVPILYRVHEAPDKEKMDFFRRFVANFGYSLPEGVVGPKILSRLVADLEGRKEERLLNNLLLRSMKLAQYRAGNIGHFGLAFKHYTHFTSPIRRYPDLVVHRLLKTILKKGRYPPKMEAELEKTLPDLALHCSEREQVATEAEREIIKLKKIRFMMEKVGEEFDGFITGVTTFGFFVELSEFMVEGLVHVSSLSDDYYVFDEESQTLIGEHTLRSFRVGDEVRVKVENVSFERRQIDFTILAESVAPTGQKHRERKGQKPRKRR